MLFQQCYNNTFVHSSIGHNFIAFTFKQYLRDFRLITVVETISFKNVLNSAVLLHCANARIALGYFGMTSYAPVVQHKLYMVLLLDFRRETLGVV